MDDLVAFMKERRRADEAAANVAELEALQAQRGPAPAS
jgi:hypothetical protein